VCSYIGNGVSSDLFSENVTLASRVTGAWRTRKEEGRKEGKRKKGETKKYQKEIKQIIK
jgi:hypothetical protein